MFERKRPKLDTLLQNRSGSQSVILRVLNPAGEVLEETESGPQNLHDDLILNIWQPESEEV